MVNGGVQPPVVCTMTTRPHGAALRQAAQESQQLDHIATFAIRLGALGPQLARLAETMATHARDQARRAQSVAAYMDQLTRDLDDATQQLRQSSGDVETSLATVTRIARQTRYLAINASIEAARAGESGRAFGVVVDEIQRLADETGGTTDDIERRIKEMHASTTRVAAMTGAEGEFEGGVASANQQTRRIAESARQQLGEADTVRSMGTDIRQLAEGLLLSVGTFRFAAHARAEREVRLLLAEIGGTTFDRSRLEAAMVRWIERHPHFELVYMTDGKGRQIVDNVACTNGRARRTTGFARDWASRPWYRRAIATDLVCATDIYRSAATGDFCFTVSVAARDPVGRIRGVIAADVNFQQLLIG